MTDLSRTFLPTSLLTSLGSPYRYSDCRTPSALLEISLTQPLLLGTGRGERRGCPSSQAHSYSRTPRPHLPSRGIPSISRSPLQLRALIIPPQVLERGTAAAVGEGANENHGKNNASNQNSSLGFSRLVWHPPAPPAETDLERDLCRPVPPRLPLVFARTHRAAVLASTAAFLDWLLRRPSGPALGKALHRQGYSAVLVPVLVQAVPAMREVLRFASELCRQASSGQYTLPSLIHL